MHLFFKLPFITMIKLSYFLNKQIDLNLNDASRLTEQVSTIAHARQWRTASD